MNFRPKPHNNIKHSPSYSNNTSILSQLPLLNSENPFLCILCLFQRGPTSKETSLGVSHAKIISSTLQTITIYTGDFPLYSLSSFPLFISSIQPDIILTYIHPSLSEILSSFLSPSITSRIQPIPHMNISFNTIQSSLHEYYQSHNSLNLNSICITTKVLDILSGISFAAQSALYTLFNLTLKSLSSTNNSNGNILNCTIEFEKLYINDIMFANYKTQNELKIFEEKLHPSLIKGQGKSKEGLSLHNMFNKCITPQGKKMLKQFFLFPLHNQEEIEMRYKCIDDLHKMKNYSFIKSICKELIHIKDIDIILNDLQKFMITFNIWNNIYGSLNSILKIFEMFKMKNNSILLLDTLFHNINCDNISKVYEFICNCLEFGKDDIKPRIKTGVNEMLDKLKEEYKGIDEVLSKLAMEYSEKLSQGSCFDKFMYVFIPQLGYMLAVEKNKKYYREVFKVYQSICSKKLHHDIKNNNNEVDGNCEYIDDTSKNNDESNNNRNEIYDLSSLTQKKRYEMGEIIEEKVIVISPTIYQHNQNNSNNEHMNVSFKKETVIYDDEDIPELQNFEETLALQQMNFSSLNIQFQFHSSEMIYFKNEITLSLDHDYGDLSARITDIENAIFREISKQILEFESDLKHTNIFISHLDIFLNFFILSEKFSLYKPILTSSPSFSFTESRNLLTELTNDSKYIRNSFSSSKSIFLISGNISSGKSVLLRMIGMLVYLAQLGCYVPAKNFSFEPFNKLLTNIDIIESSIEHISGFTIELREIKEIVDILTNDFSIRSINDSNVMILLDNPFKRTSNYNQKCLMGGLIKYITKLVKDAEINERRNKKCKVFITMSNEMKEFLIKRRDIVDWEVVGIYEMGMKEEKEGMVGNTFTLKEVGREEGMNEIKEEGKGRKLFLARNCGLDNVLFMRSLEVYNVIGNGGKMFLNVEKLHKVANGFRRNIGEINGVLRKYCEEFLKGRGNGEGKKDKSGELSDNGEGGEKGGGCEGMNEKWGMKLTDFQEELRIIDVLNKVFV